MSMYHLIIAFMGMPEPFRLRPVHLGFAMFLGFCLYPFSKRVKKTRIPWYDWTFAIMSILVVLHIQFNYERITWRYPYLDPLFLELF